MKRKIYGILDAEGNTILVCLRKEQAWYQFFQNHLHRLPLAEAIRAYEAIGYRRVEVDMDVPETDIRPILKQMKTDSLITEYHPDMGE